MQTNTDKIALTLPQLPSLPGIKSESEMKTKVAKDNFRDIYITVNTLFDNKKITNLFDSSNNMELIRIYNDASRDEIESAFFSAAEIDEDDRDLFSYKLLRSDGIEITVKELVKNNDKRNPYALVIVPKGGGLFI